MADFLYVYRNSNEWHTADEMQQQMQKWMDWMKDLGAKGHLKLPGDPLDRTGKVVAGEKKLVTDGPYAEKDLVSGFSVIAAKDIEEAVELSRGCPIFLVGGKVEIRPILSMP